MEGSVEPSSVGRAPVPPEVREALAEKSITYGRYVVVQELGRGGMGVVFKAWHIDLGRWVALKTMIAGALSHPADRERFIREARTAAQFTHPNIAQIYEVGEADDELFLAMQFIEGETLAQLKSLSVQRAAEIVRDAAYALHHAHERKVIHRDVKPQNIMVDRSGQVFVLDFGMARALDAPSGLSGSGAVIGTPSYMPPEQARGERTKGPAGDVYSLGATLYFALTGHKPFEAATPYAIIDMVLNEDPIPPSARAAHVPPDLDAIVLKAMQKLPSRRYPNARALGDDLQRFVRGEPVQARPPSFLVRAQRVAMRHKTASAVTAVGLLAAVALGLTFAVSSRREAKLREEKAARERELIEASVGVAEIGQEIEAWTVALYKPAHPLKVERDGLAGLAARLEALRVDTPGRWRFLGRAYELLDELPRAEETYGKGEVWQERGRVRLMRYRRLQRMTEDARNQVGRAHFEAQSKQLREGALADLGRSSEGALRLQVLEGKDVYGDALARAEKTIDADAWDLAAQAALVANRADEAVRHAQWAARIRESDADLQVAAAYAHLRHAQANRTNPGEAGKDYEAADRYCDVALVIFPESRDVLAMRAQIAHETFWMFWETHDLQAVGGREAFVARLKAGADMALKAYDRVEHPECAFWGCNLLMRAGWMARDLLGEDPTPWIERMHRESDRLMQELPALKMPTERGYAYVVVAEWQMRQPQPDTALLARYAEECEKLMAAEYGEGQHDRWYYPGLCFFYLGQARGSAEQVEKSVAWFTRAQGTADPGPLSLKFRGHAYFALQRYAEAIRDWTAMNDPAMEPFIQEARRRMSQ